MAFRIGFLAEQREKKPAEVVYTAPQTAAAPRRSVVQIYFEKRHLSLAYYNDRFDLHRGDMVYVDGKLEGLLGRVTEVHYNFKIRISDYKRVVAVADTAVHGQFFMAESHFVTFDRGALPAEKVITWFRAPEEADDDAFVSGSDGMAFCLDDLNGMPIDAATAERGHEYYMENKVRYLCIDNGKGYAIVEGSKSYEVEFCYDAGKISNLVCSCFCSGSCKHEFAAVLQLKDILEQIETDYADQYTRSGYFAAIGKGILFAFTVDGKERGTFTL